MRYFIFLAYNGKNFCGWQSQKNAVSVQSTIEERMSILLKEPVKITGCGRTDTGVHARAYIAHFDSENISGFQHDDFIYKINSFLPHDIVIFDVKQVISTANSRFDATERTYEYHISGIKNPFKNDLCYFISLSKFNLIDVNLFNEGCKILKTYDDFTSFSKTGTLTKTNNCKIFDAYAVKDNFDFVFTITADRFLRNMVRAITGTLLDVALKKISINELIQIIESKNRSNAGESLPAQGLFLTKVKYPQELFI